MYKKEVADIEVYPNYFLYVGHGADNEEIYEYSLHSSDTENTIGEFIDRMRDNIAMIGFNNIGYDYPVLHHIFTNDKKFRHMCVSNVCDQIYNFSKNLIESEEKQWINPKEYIIPQLDLFQIHHFTNKARRTSLKAIEIALYMDNIEDLPYDPHTYITKEQSETVRLYCHHDVKATKLFYKASIKEIEMRKGLTETYNIDLINANDAKIGSEITLKFVSEHMNTPAYEIKKMRTYRKGIDLNNLILPYISFESDDFKSVLKYFKSTIINDTKGDLSYSILFRGVKYDYGTGGIHACTDNGTYENNDQWMILDIDVTSFYPNLAIRNKKAPQHLGESFCKVYEDMFEKRKTFPKGSPENYGMKISLNSVYGKSNDIYSYLYDPQFTMFITVNGQLLISMLTERILLRTDAILLQANTDGITVKVPRSQYDDVKNIMSLWEKLTSLELEEAEYKSMFIMDVNNYMAVTTTDKYKFKGSFEINKAWHKDISHRIVPIAVARCLLYGIAPQQTFLEHFGKKVYDDIIIDGKPAIAHGIYDFCGSIRARSGAKFYTEYIKNNTHTIEPLGKTNRYFVSNKGVKLRKELPPDKNKKDDIIKHKDKFPNQMNLFDFTDDVLETNNRVSYIEANNLVTMFNRSFEGPYDINYRYYLEACNRILNKL